MVLTLIYLIFRQQLAWLAFLTRDDAAKTAQILLLRSSQGLYLVPDRPSVTWEALLAVGPTLAPRSSRLLVARQFLRAGRHVRGEDVVGVPVKIPAGAVVAHRGAGVGVPGGLSLRAGRRCAGRFHGSLQPGRTISVLGR
jgi:hypothetical protein